MYINMQSPRSRKPRGKKLLVAGGAGYVGSVLVPRLIDAGYHVVVLDRFFFGETLLTSGLASGDSLHLARADIRDFDPSLLEGVDSVIDLCGISNDPACDLNPQITWAINIGGASRLIDLSLAAGVRRYVYASSCSVYGHGQQLQMTEAMPCAPMTLYAQSKLLTEQKLLNKGREACGAFEPVVLRLATLFGVSPRMRFDLALNTMAKCAYTERKIRIDGDGCQWRPFVHVNDVASAFIIAIEASSGRVSNKTFNIGSGENNRQIRQLASEIKIFLPASEITYSAQKGDLRNYNVDFTLAEDELEFAASTSVAQGIQEVIRALALGIVNPNDDRSHTVKHYRALFAHARIDAKLPAERGQAMGLSS